MKLERGLHIVAIMSLVFAVIVPLSKFFLQPEFMMIINGTLPFQFVVAFVVNVLYNAFLFASISLGLFALEKIVKNINRE